MTTIRRCYHLFVLAVFNMLHVAPALSISVHNAFPASLYQIDNLKAKCLDPMVAASGDDNKITPSELHVFIKLLAKANNISDPKFEKDNYLSLPEAVIMEYNILVCQNVSNDSSTCQDGLDVRGAKNLSSVGQKQKEFLETICKEFLVTMRKELGPSPQPSLAPSSSPTDLPTRTPSISPTDVPSLKPSRSPSGSPSSKPSLVPTARPSIEPSTNPSGTPSISPSFEPTLNPSSEPSPIHTRMPSSHPSKSPNKSPTISPSDSPSDQASASPSAKPSPYVAVKPSSEPSVGPTDRPSQKPSEVVYTVAIEFGVANMNGYRARDVANNVEGSLGMIESIFDEFSEEVKEALFVQTIGGRSRYRKLQNASQERSLGVEFNHNYVTNIQEEGCPDFIKKRFKHQSPPPSCQKMDGVVIFISTYPSNPMILEGMIQSRAEDLLQKNVMSNKIPDEMRDQYVIYSLRIGETTIPVAMITGFSIGSALLGLFVGRLLVRRKIRSKGGDQYDGLNHVVAGSGDLTMDDEECGSPSNHHRSPSSYRGLAEEALYERRDIHDISMERSIASSSNAGSSGWSSSAGISSLNTASVDSTEYFGSSLAAIGAASVISKRYETSPGSRGEMYPIVADIDESSMSESDLGGSELETDDEMNMSPTHNRRQFEVKEELEHAIRSGDWSLVGATAAIIAQAPNEFLQSDVNSSFSSDPSSQIRPNQRKNERAAELDRLVELGDWEGVVLAAAKFEAENDRDGATEGSASFSEGQKFLASKGIFYQGDNNSTNSPSVSTNFSESASNNHKRAEVRAEVEALVRRVVPDEIDNVDEMLCQFKGREEELVETLRTMQERSIAARQREANRKNAKREARKLAKQNKPPLGRPSPGRPSPGRPSPGSQDKAAKKDMSLTFFSSSSFVDNDCGSRRSLQSKEQSNASHTSPTRAALDHAIQIGDWEAVGKTAEQIGEVGSVASEYHSADETSTLISSKSLSSRPDAERAAELEVLIDQGDWSGVVAAANRYTAADVEAKGRIRRHNRNALQNNYKESNSVATESSWKLPLIGESTSFDPQLDDCISQSTEDKKEKTMKEEKDALAQAEIWMTIAAQSKSENSNATKGASDAADWAISRSLKQIQASSDERHETGLVASSNDGKSV